MFLVTSLPSEIFAQKQIDQNIQGQFFKTNVEPAKIDFKELISKVKADRDVIHTDFKNIEKEQKRSDFHAS